MKFTIDRKTWIRGKGAKDSYLLRQTDKNRCCVGQMCGQVGIPNKALLQRRAISSIALPGNTFIDKLVKAGFISPTSHDEQPWLGRAYSINDDITLTGEIREAKLIVLLKEIGHELVFTN